VALAKCVSATYEKNGEECSLHNGYLFSLMAKAIAYVTEDIEKY